MIHLKKETIYKDPERTTVSDIKANEDQWKQIEKLAVEASKVDYDGLGEKAKDFKASGRRCPKCGNILKIKEVTENGIYVLNCFDCYITVHANDLETTDDVTDHIYRTIPDSLVNYYMSFFEKTRGRG